MYRFLLPFLWSLLLCSCSFPSFFLLFFNYWGHPVWLKLSPDDSNKNNMKVPQLQTIKIAGQPLSKHSAKMNSMVFKNGFMPRNHQQIKTETGKSP